MDKFYTKVDVEDEPTSEEVSAEAINIHKSFCKEWVTKHYKNLTPLVTSAAESMATEFYDYFQSRMHPEYKLTCMELSRIFMRHPAIAPEFASCLHYSMTNIEQVCVFFVIPVASNTDLRWQNTQTRGGRNASYKQMNMVSMAKVQSYNKFGNWLQDNEITIAGILRDVQTIHGFHFHPLIIDWYKIAGQMPHVHKSFEGYINKNSKWQQEKGSKAVPPWKLGRD
jgi:hypothetical protein